MCTKRCFQQGTMWSAACSRRVLSLLLLLFLVPLPLLSSIITCTANPSVWTTIMRHVYFLRLYVTVHLGAAGTATAKHADPLPEFDLLASTSRLRVQLAGGCSKMCTGPPGPGSSHAGHALSCEFPLVLFSSPDARTAIRTWPLPAEPDAFLVCCQTCPKSVLSKAKLAVKTIWRTVKGDVPMHDTGGATRGCL